MRELRVPLKPIYGKPKHDALVTRMRMHKEELKGLRK